MVVDVTSGSEAERGGVRANDVVVSIDGQKPTSMADARTRLAGRAGTDVVLELLRAETPVRLRITRQAVRR
jgi:C-terminal processing protease CtpA/Prc